MTPEHTRTARETVGPEKLVAPARFTLRCGVHDLDVEGRPKGVPRYQELLYEATRFELQALILVGNRNLYACGGEFLRNRPGNAPFVGNAKNDSRPALHADHEFPSSTSNGKASS